VTLQNISHVQFKLFTFFPNLTHKTKTGIANMWETTNSKPPEPIIMIDQAETGSSSEMVYISHSSLAGGRLLLCLLTISANCAKMIC
jgi:hypothetical protein